MPYIKKEDQKLYDGRLDDLCFALEEQGYIDGHVTYVLFKIMARWFFNSPAYSTIASIRGCLAGTLSEFDRKHGFPYEDKKIRENGNVDLEQKEPLKLTYYMCPCCGTDRGVE
ncbi:hypothetical protein LCGC14_2162250 [marine sediment metagenome]|uniref:Uncharacterized protein n=1 Tax=marine sediment metagenome TaxID=412755 RepID=A0A0F9GNJ9_9ZZZZ